MIGGDRAPLPVLALIVLLLPVYFVIRLAIAAFQLKRTGTRALHLLTGKLPDFTPAQ